MQRAQEAGLREGWRGAVAYAASPWLWREGAFRWFAVVVIILSAWWVVDGVTSPGSTDQRLVGAALRTVFVVLVVALPLVRAACRRRTLAA